MERHFENTWFYNWHNKRYEDEGWGTPNHSVQCVGNKRPAQWKLHTHVCRCVFGLYGLWTRFEPHQPRIKLNRSTFWIIWVVNLSTVQFSFCGAALASTLYSAHQGPALKSFTHLSVMSWHSVCVPSSFLCLINYRTTVCSGSQAHKSVQHGSQQDVLCNCFMSHSWVRHGSGLLSAIFTHQVCIWKNSWSLNITFTLSVCV